MGSYLFLAVNDVVDGGGEAVDRHASLVQRVRMPPEVLVVGDALGLRPPTAISFALVVVYCVWRGHLGRPGVGWIVLGLVDPRSFFWIIGASLCVSLVGAFLPISPK